MNEASFTFIDLFAGIGGFRLAFEGLGGKCVFASEWDSYAQYTYADNFHHIPDGDITQISELSIPSHDILTAGFPCQPFSIAGVSKHNALGNAHGFAHTTQGTLFFDVARIIAARRPRAFILENVKNLLSHDKRRTFKVIRQTLDELGYHVHTRVVDARNLVPQHRERVYIVGFRDDVEFDFPIIPNLRPRLRDILEPEVDSKYTLTDNMWLYLQNYADKHRAKGNGFGFGLADFDGVTRTLSARYYKDGSEILIPQPNQNPRRLTPRECARLMGYPEWFQIKVSDTRAYKQFGNSVVVPVIRLIAQEVVQCLNRQSRQHMTRTLLTSPKAPYETSDELYLNGVPKTIKTSRGVTRVNLGTH